MVQLKIVLKVMPHWLQVACKLSSPIHYWVTMLSRVFFALNVVVGLQLDALFNEESHE